MADEAKCVAQFIQLLNNWLCHVRLGTVMEKNWALSFEQCRLQVLQFSVHLIHLLSILLERSGFVRIQKAVVDQTGSRPLNSDHNLFLVQVWFQDMLWSSFSVQTQSWSFPGVVYNPVYIAHQISIEKWSIVVT